MSELVKSVPTSVWAQRYIDTFNLALVPIEPGEKAPKGIGWNKPGGYIIEAAQAALLPLPQPLLFPQASS